MRVCLVLSYGFVTSQALCIFDDGIAAEIIMELSEMAVSNYIFDQDLENMSRRIQHKGKSCINFNEP